MNQVFCIFGTKSSDFDVYSTLAAYFGCPVAQVAHGSSGTAHVPKEVRLCV